MEKDNTQKELFEFAAPPKKQSNGFGRIFQKTDFTVSIGAEKLVFVLIGIIMLVVVSFALGVERGKAISAKAAETAGAPAQASAQAPAANAPVQQAVQAKKAAAVTNIAPKEKTREAAAAKTVTDPVQAQNAGDKNKPYTIVAAAFYKEAFAIKEVSRLKGIGLESFVYYSEPYYLACAGSFTSKDSAQKTLAKVRQLHRDAYVRLR